MTPHALSLCAAVSAIRAGEITSEAYIHSLLERIEATDPEVRAWVHVDPESALRSARACQAQGAGALAGVGIGVKDIIATQSQPTQFGSPIYAGASAPYDAECVTRLQRAGGFVLGKTVTTEFAFMEASKTRNPWRSAHTPGGSSSGSAAAVACGQVAAALGTQTNGSVIRPAAFCGVVGFKPTHDALPMAGVGAFSPTLDTLGVFARNVADCARLASCLAEDGRISETSPAAAPPRLALLAGYPWTTLDATQENAFAQAAAKLRAAGARIDELALPDPCSEAGTVQRTIMFREGAQQLGELQSRERGRMSAKLNAALDEGRAVSDGDYRSALARRAAMIAAATAWLAPYDAILCAPARGVAPADLSQTGDPACCTLWTLLGFPALTIPIALSEGMPLGLQLASIAGADDRLLAVALWCEARLPFKGLV